MEKITIPHIVPFVGLLVSFWAFAMSNITHAQPQNDAQAIFLLTLDKQVTKSININFMQQYQLNENYSELGSASYQLGIEHQLVKGIKISAAYRLINSRNEANFYEQQQRFYGDINLSRKIGRWTLALREAYQRQYKGWQLLDNPFRVSSIIRSRLQLRYSPNWYLTPYISGEIYTQLHRPDRLPLSRINARVGFSYRFDLHNSIDLAFTYQKNINSPNARTNYISMIGYNLGF